MNNQISMRNLLVRFLEWDRRHPKKFAKMARAEADAAGNELDDLMLDASDIVNRHRAVHREYTG